MIPRLDDPPVPVQTRAVDAMNTTFTLRLAGTDAARATEAAAACFDQLERLEADLSRFRHDSDVTRINHLAAGASLLVADTTYACLRLALEMHAVTDGLFDVTLGAETWPAPATSPTPAPTAQRAGQFELAPDQPRVTCVTPGRQVDLGGIGKGFALDQLAVTLGSFGIESALLAAGASTLLAIGPQPWPIELTGDQARQRMTLQQRALSASGTGIQGAHVVRSDQPVGERSYRFRRVWLVTEAAARADALSTACLLMSDGEIGAFAGLHRGELEIYAEEPGATEIRAI